MVIRTSGEASRCSGSFVSVCIPDTVVYYALMINIYILFNYIRAGDDVEIRT